MPKKKNKKSSSIRQIPSHPLAEVFGFPYDNHSDKAIRYRKHRLCPFNNKVPNCTKDKANDPLGTCSIYDGSNLVITCPVRFRENWRIAQDAAEFFFPDELNWTSLAEVKLKDKTGGSAGNIDIVLVAYDDNGSIVDFGSLEVQAVYISGNVRRPFRKYMELPQANSNMDWTKEVNYPNPDYLSSSRKRLAPQLLYKGGILNAWKKKSAVAINTGFFETLPKFNTVSQSKAEIAWFVYDLEYSKKIGQYELNLKETVYTDFNSALKTITTSEPGDIKNFISILQEKLDQKLEENNPPDAPTLDQIISGGN